MCGGVAMELPLQLPRSAVPGKARTAHQRRNGARLGARHREALQQIQNAPPRSLSEQVVPLAGFLGGKFTSHVLLGAGLGAFGAAVQPSFQARSVMQLIAGGFLLLLAANLLGAPVPQVSTCSAPLAVTRVRAPFCAATRGRLDGPGGEG